MLVLGSICLCSWMMAQPGQQNTVQQSSITEPCNMVMMMTMIGMVMMVMKMNTAEHCAVVLHHRTLQQPANSYTTLDAN